MVSLNENGTLAFPCGQEASVGRARGSPDHSEHQGVPGAGVAGASLTAGPRPHGGSPTAHPDSPSSEAAGC